MSLEKEKNNFIVKYQKDDIIQRLSALLGDSFIKYREEFNKTQNYLETDFIPDRPLMVCYELRNRCNLNCIMCYNDHHKEPHASLSLEVVEKTLKEAKDLKVPSLLISMAAEIMTYKDIKEVLRASKESGAMDIFIGTNGLLLNDDIIKYIVDQKFTRITISVDAATNETYKKIRNVNQLDRLESNINKIIDYKKKVGSQFPFVRVTFVLQNENKHEVNQFVEKWKDRADYIDFQRLVFNTHIKSDVEVDTTKIKDPFCAYPFYALNVWANGNITPCCSFYGTDMVLGNVYKDSLIDVWNGKKLQEIRDQIKERKYNPNCAKCLYYKDNEIMNNLE